MARTLSSMSCNLESSLTCSSKSSGASTQLLQPCPRTTAFRPFQSKQRNNRAQLCIASNKACSAANTSADDPTFIHLSRRQLLQIAGTSAFILQQASDSKVHLLHTQLDQVNCVSTTGLLWPAMRSGVAWHFKLLPFVAARQACCPRQWTMRGLL